MARKRERRRRVTSKSRWTRAPTRRRRRLEEEEEEEEEGTGSDGKKRGVGGRDKANVKDGGDASQGPEITRRATRGMADNADVAPVRRRDSRETKLWNLVAWRFLAEPDWTEDVNGGALLRHADVGPALDSFRTLYCPRCHHYDCNLHGCGHAQPTVKLGEEEASRNPHHRSKTHMEAARRAAKEAEEAAAAAPPPRLGARRAAKSIAPRSLSHRAGPGVGSSTPWRRAGTPRRRA